MRSSTPRFSFLVVLTAMLAMARLAAAAPAWTATGAAVATGSDLLETTIVVEKRVPAAGSSAGAGHFVPAQRLDAGEQAYYTIRVRNPGKAPVTNVEVTKRMPDGMEYVDGSATGPACAVGFSIDGGESFVSRPARGPLTHLRWSLRQPLPPGATALLRFRATFR